MPKRSSNFQNKIQLYAVRFVLWAIGILPLHLSMRAGQVLAGILAKFFPRLKKTARRNLEIAFPQMPDAEREKIVRGVFESLGRHLGFVSHFRKFKPEDIRGLVEIVGREENFEPAHATGKGILFFTGHFGSWEIFNLLPLAFGYEMNILVRRIDNPLVEEFVDKMRTRFGAVTLDKTKAARRMFRILENGGLLGILADLNVQEREGIFVDFFGIPASTTTSIARLALATNAVVMPAFAVWEESRQKYVIYLDPPIAYQKTGNSAKDIKEITEKVTKVVENYVRQYPEQWLWIHKRWNTRPQGEKSIY